MAPTSKWSQAKSWVKENPYWTGTGAFYGAAPAIGAAKLIKEKGPAAIDYISEALVPEWAEKALPQNWPIFNKEKDKIKTPPPKKGNNFKVG